MGSFPGREAVLTLCKLGGAAVQGLLEQVPGPLQLLATVAVDELGEVGVPDIVHVWPAEQRDASLVRLRSRKTQTLKGSRVDHVFTPQPSVAGGIGGFFYISYISVCFPGLHYKHDFIRTVYLRIFA